MNYIALVSSQSHLLNPYWLFRELMTERGHTSAAQSALTSFGEHGTSKEEFKLLLLEMDSADLVVCFSPLLPELHMLLGVAVAKNIPVVLVVTTGLPFHQHYYHPLIHIFEPPSDRRSIPKQLVHAAEYWYSAHPREHRKEES